MKKCKVSVIMPTFGRTDYLYESIKSVFDQRFKDFELIVVDDNNPDSIHRLETQRIVNIFIDSGKKIKYHQHPVNMNGAVARNTGFRMSSGDYISFLDSDDFYDPNRLEELVKILDDAPQSVGGVYSGVEFRRGGKRKSVFKGASFGNFIVETLACKFMLGTGSNLFLRREAVSQLNGFDESFWRHQDYEFMVRFFQCFDISATNKVLVIKNNENFNLPDFERSLRIKKKFLNKYEALISSLNAREKKYIIRSNYIWLGEIALREGARRESEEMYRIASLDGGISMRETLRRFSLWLLSWR